MKNQLKKLSREKGFISRNNLVSVNDDYYYYLWMCELQKWLREKGVLIWINYFNLSSSLGYAYNIIALRNGICLLAKEQVASSTDHTYEERLGAALFEGLTLIEDESNIKRKPIQD
jgi:hypothetical protein